MKKTIVYRLFLISFLFTLTLQAQLIKVTASDMMTESDIYKDSKGVMYSDIVKFKAKTKMADTQKGEEDVDESKIKISNIKTALNDVRKKYGNFKIIKAYPDLVWGDTKRIHKRTKKVVDVIDLSQTYILEFENIIPYDSVTKYLSSIEEIEYAEGPMIAYLTSTNPNDPWYYNSSGQGPYRWSFDVIKAQLAWDITHGSPLIRVGVHDRFNVQVPLHQEIASKVVWESSWNSQGYHGDHGTMVAGIVGASTNNNTDIASLGWNTSLMLAQSNFSNIPLLVNEGADIINFSWIFDEFSDDLRNQIIFALQNGVICIASAGNDQSNLQQLNLSIPAVVYPAGYNFGSLGQVIAVSATEMYNNAEQFKSNFNYSPGTNLSSTGFIDFGASGTNYRSLSWNSVSGTRHIWEGTSVAAPFVSALVALMLSVNSTLTVNQVYDILRRTTDRIGQFSYDSNGWNQYLGYGRIDAANAVYVAAGQPAKPRGMYLS